LVSRMWSKLLGEGEAEGFGSLQLIRIPSLASGAGYSLAAVESPRGPPSANLRGAAGVGPPRGAEGLARRAGLHPNKCPQCGGDGFVFRLDCKEIQAVHPKGDQSWVFIGRTDADAETPILWPPDVKN